MFDMMSQARNAIEAYNEALKASSANIANMNVIGYKRVDVSFQTVFERVINQGSAASNEMGGTNPKQLGSSMNVANVSVDFSDGEYASANNIDLAISGNGLFIVSADNGETFRYTRAGQFSLNSSGNLVTAAGHQVYGLNSSGSLVAITGLLGNASDYSWNSGTGTLLYSGTDTGYRIALTSFTNPNGLVQADGSTFMETTASGAPATPREVGGNVGSILTGQLEQSNVFYLGESIDALEIQRAMSANLTMVRLASDIISSFIKSLGG
ncbi:hypothetical protein A2291_03220 [candidate division WOR-1 bacterium RIFOXYB2_FULL_42_35]|uniref:Flagellar hook protein FlgE/F/G-like D1 domain-containing protein n=1 Tax=candidate division WOR-1 bacterium RIFOXYC2_FULL_41_25 TaxID=1802586 RepID=A0A1F4TIW4_UNCSA|nr:MAG: hypothetical protein A2247_02295 [candidate division WOR-1 bacterium RIFOXYA2_FULL_41_14]OGC21569.1 MAG: hypothetical protein A2291_03220 [candidate division WOR-1 bacterium RIFOXYB2_FULL_42_35]OGC32547.1 MAG: hypothetical protein A2462_02930 [candidate division WOR-1 bacterium RIFOXYC2_FULL_41_25]